MRNIHFEVNSGFYFIYATFIRLILLCANVNNSDLFYFNISYKYIYFVFKLNVKLIPSTIFRRSG